MPAAVDLERGVLAALALGSLLTVITCSGARLEEPAAPTISAPTKQEAAPKKPATPAPRQATPTASAAASVPLAELSAAPADAAPPGATEPEAAPHVLDAFYAQLRELEAGTRTSHVRVLWMGDSHTAADFWTHVVRKELQKRFGAGGPGFVHIAVKHYRHSQALASHEGKWRTEPRNPAVSTRVEDGVFGLGGIRASFKDGSARAKVRLLESAVSKEASWDLMYRLPTAATRFKVTLAGKAHQLTSKKAGIQHFRAKSPPKSTLELEPVAGAPELFGVIVEDEQPGVVLDTLGINGARAATPLAWKQQPFVDLVRARAPSLFILAYGSNEVGANTPVERYATHYERLLGRLRLAAPGAACVLIGPTDQVKNGASHPRVSEIEEVQRQTAARLGCSYFSAWQAMGGEGSMSRWVNETPPLAQSDKVHLTRAGYQKVGEQIARHLLEGY